MEDYFSQFGDKACCFEDLRGCLDEEIVFSARWKAVLAGHQPSFVSRYPKHLKRLLMRIVGDG